MSASDQDIPTVPAWGDVSMDDPVEQAAAEFGRILCDRSDEPVVLSGDMSKPLADQPFSEGVANPLWNACENETVAQLHRLYRDAGANAAVTNTLGCAAPAIAAAGLDVPVRDANDRAVRAAYTSASRYVVGAVGPCGIDLSLRANPVATEGAAPDAALNEARAAYREQARRLKWNDCHALLVTRMRSVTDATTAVDACSQVFDRPIVCCVECVAPAACDAAPADGPSHADRLAGARMPDGTPIDEAFRELARAGAHGLGVCVPLRDAEKVVDQAISLAKSLGRGAAFVLDVADCPLRGRSLDREFGRVAGLLRRAGVCVIGCGVGSSVGHTAAVSDAVLAVDDRRRTDA